MKKISGHIRSGGKLLYDGCCSHSTAAIFSKYFASNYIIVKGTVHQMYECVSEVLLHLGRMSGIVFTARTAQIWPEKKRVLTKCTPRPLRSAPASF